MTKPLSERHCEPCTGKTPPLDQDERSEYLGSLDDRWELEEGHHLTAEFAFPDFLAALEFTNQVGGLAEGEGHHPELLLSPGRVRVRIWTHAIDDLSENDFILAAKIDALQR
jgi:4a-hydroxytetrahydrobiopterin dehydratase